MDVHAAQKHAALLRGAFVVSNKGVRFGFACRVVALFRVGLKGMQKATHSRGSKSLRPSLRRAG